MELTEEQKNELIEAFNELAEKCKEILNSIKEMSSNLFENIKLLFKYVKASKYISIYNKTKKKRIKKKQLKFIKKILEEIE